MSGGGVLKEANVHDIDLLTYLFGDFTIGNVTMDENSQKMESFVDADLHFKDDLIVFFNSFLHNVNNRGTSRRIEIYCENGTIVADDFMFYGPVSHTIEGKDEKRIERKELYRQFMQQEGINPKFKRFKQWYSSLADYSFIQNVKDGKEGWPGIMAGAKADQKVQEMYQIAKNK